MIFTVCVTKVRVDPICTVASREHHAALIDLYLPGGNNIDHLDLRNASLVGGCTIEGFEMLASLGSFSLHGNHFECKDLVGHLISSPGASVLTTTSHSTVTNTSCSCFGSLQEVDAHNQSLRVRNKASHATSIK